MCAAATGEDDAAEILREVREVVAIAQGSANKATRLLRTFRGHAPRTPGGVPARVDVGDSIRATMALLACLAQRSSARLAYVAPATDVFLRTASPRLAQLVATLTTNGIEAVAEKGRGSVTLQLRDAGESVELAVIDDGIGVAAAALAHVFEPFFTTKHARGAPGLGLTLAADIVERDLHGRIEVASTEGMGTTVTVRVPKDCGG